MGQNQPITLGAAAVMALLAAPVLAQTSPKLPPAPGPLPATPPAKPAVEPIEGLGVPAPPARSAPAALAPKVLVEPLILWQPEGATIPRPAAARSPSPTAPGRPPGGAVRSVAGPSRPNGQVDPFAPMGPRVGINPFLPGMAPQGAGGSQMDPRRRGGASSPGGDPPGARPQQRLRQGSTGMPMGPGGGSLGGPQGLQMSEGMMPPPPGAIPPGAGTPGPGEIPPVALPPGVVPPGVQAPDAPATGSPLAGAKSAQEWSPWPSLLATLGLGGGGVLLAFVARRRSASGSPTRVAIDEGGRKNAPPDLIQTGDKTD